MDNPVVKGENGRYAIYGVKPLGPSNMLAWTSVIELEEHFVIKMNYGIQMDANLVGVKHTREEANQAAYEYALAWVGRGDIIDKTDKAPGKLEQTASSQ
jgi:hypothetical protein